MADLELVETEELIAELLGRCDHGAVVLLRCSPKGDDWHDLVTRWRGNSHTVAGLLADTQREVLNEMTRKEEDEEDG